MAHEKDGSDTLERFRVEYGNTTGPTDEHFEEWWEVSDSLADKIVAKCDEELWANKIAKLLNAANDTGALFR